MGSEAKTNQLIHLSIVGWGVSTCRERFAWKRVVGKENGCWRDMVCGMTMFGTERNE